MAARNATCPAQTSWSLAQHRLDVLTPASLAGVTPLGCTPCLDCHHFWLLMGSICWVAGATDTHHKPPEGSIRCSPPPYHSLETGMPLRRRDYALLPPLLQGLHHMSYALMNSMQSCA